MKKTEKIELRVDHEEKDRLSSIAERRGQTISDVVREALSHELGAPNAGFPKWPGYVAIGAVFLSVIALGHSIWSKPSIKDTLTYPTALQIYVTAARSNPISFDLPLNSAFEKSVDIRPRDSAPIRVSIKSEGRVNNILGISAQSCVLENDSCDLVDLPSISVQTRPSRRSSAQTSATLPTGQTVELSVSTVTHQRSPAKSKSDS